MFVYLFFQTNFDELRVLKLPVDRTDFLLDVFFLLVYLVKFLLQLKPFFMFLSLNLCQMLRFLLVLLILHHQVSDLIFDLHPSRCLLILKLIQLSKLKSDLFFEWVLKSFDVLFFIVYLWI
jgi:hypothetical protein